MSKKRAVSELEQRLCQEVMARVEGKERFDATEELLRQYKKSLDESFARRAKENEALMHSLMWFARISFVSLIALAIGFLFIVGSGLYYGQVPVMSRYSKKIVSLQNEPTSFWISIAFHSFMAFFSSLIAYRCGRATKRSTTTPPDTKID